MNSLVLDIMATTNFWFDAKGADGAFGNLRLTANDAHINQKDVLKRTSQDFVARDDDVLGLSRKCGIPSFTMCLNHRNGLVEAVVTSHTGPKTVACLYSTSCFLRMGGHFTRLVSTADCLMCDEQYGIQVIRGKAPKLLAAYNAELCAYVLDNWRQDWAHHRSGTSPKVGKQAVVIESAFKRAVREYFKFIYISDNKVVHYCSSRSCCKGYNIHVTRKRAPSCLLRLTIPCPQDPSRANGPSIGVCSCGPGSG